MTNLLARLFIKDYKNTDNYKVREQYGKLAGITGIITNLLLFVMKITVGAIFNSIAIIADSINNLSDSASSIVTVVGFKLSGKPADEKHPYGHARIEYIAGMIVSFIILVLGLQLGKSSFDKILSPEETVFSYVTVGILVASILIKVWQCLFYRRIAKTIASSTLKATSADSFNDVVATTVVLIGAIISQFSGFNLDGYMGMAVALFIIVSGIRLVIETANPLLGLPPTKKLVKELEQRITSHEEILGIHDLKVHNYGASSCFATVHCEVASDQDMISIHEVIDGIEREVFKEMNINLVIHMDPVVINDEQANELKQTIQEFLGRLSEKIQIHDFRVVWGEESNHVIFDIAVPFQFEYTDEQLESIISDKIKELDDSYSLTLVVDHEGEFTDDET